MKYIVLVVLLLSLFVTPTPTVIKASGGEHTTMSGLPHDIYLIRVHSGTGWQYRYTYKQSEISKLYGFNGPNIWIGYERGAWDVPDGSSWESYIELYSRSRPSDPYYLWIVSAPSNRAQTKYVFLYNSLKTWCDSKGQHCGNHDWVYDNSSGVKLATTFAVPASDIYALYSSVDYSSLGR